VIGENRTRLNSYLDGVSKKSIQDIRDTAKTWSRKATTLNNIAYALGGTRASGMAEGFGDKSEVARAANKAFTEASTKLTNHAKQLNDGSKTLDDAATALENAHHYKTKIDKRDADATDPTKSADTNKTDDETQSKTYTDAIDTAYGDAILAMRKVHGDQPAPPPPSGSGGGGPSYPGLPNGGPGGGSGGGLLPGGGGHIGPGGGTGTHPGGGTDPGGGTHPGGPHPIGGPGPIGDPGGWLQGGGGDPPSVPTGPIVGGPGGAPVPTGGVPGAGGTGGAGGAGLAGAGAFGGLGAYGAGGSGAALRFTPGQAIGVSRSTISSAGLLGAEENGAAAGGRTLSAGGTVGRGGVGAGGGRGAGAAGGRRTGAAAGGRGRSRRDEDRDDAAPDLWDDGDEWVDDEGMGPSVMR
jgi:exonuclease VII small subunit